MNAVEIEEAVSRLAEAPFDAATFPFAFLEAFGNKETTIKRLQSGTTNQSDVAGGVLQRHNIHITVCVEGARRMITPEPWSILVAPVFSSGKVHSNVPLQLDDIR